MESRQEFNREILKRISEYNEKYPDMRFHQILHNLNIIETKPEVDESSIYSGQLVIKHQYNQESKETLQIVNQSMH
jgi:hypothetical protein